MYIASTTKVACNCQIRSNIRSRDEKIKDKGCPAYLLAAKESSIQSLHSSSCFWNAVDLHVYVTLLAKLVGTFPKNKRVHKRTGESFSTAMCTIVPYLEEHSPLTSSSSSLSQSGSVSLHAPVNNGDNETAVMNTATHSAGSNMFFTRTQRVGRMTGAACFLQTKV